MRPNRAPGLAAVVLAAGMIAAVPAPELRAQEEAAREPAAPAGPALRFGVEAKAAFRDSDANRFPVPFSFGGAPLFLTTVDPGESLELVNVALFVDAVWGEALVGHLKVDFVDLYDRNPTSTDRRIDVDEAWLRYGRESDPGFVPERPGAYVKVGKIPKLERQDDRHLESYGLAATAFNRFEDLGVEVGVDLGRHAFAKATWTRGNPLFLRDPNALAGDNGTEDQLAGRGGGLGSGVPILYDAEVEDVSAEEQGELGGALGLRFATPDGGRRVEVLAFAYQRTLAATVDLEGTLYGGDLDLLSDPFPPPPQLAGDEQRELGGNFWLYLDGFSFFAQYVDQEIASLPRVGWEAEVAWRFELPLVWAVAGQQLFPSVAPAVRYSELDPEFTNPPRTPAPSFAWDWEKLDGGVRLGITPGSDLTVEYARNRFLTARGWRDNDELLATLRWRM